MTAEKNSLRRLISAGLANQLISSLTNFAFGLYLLRTLAPHEYGLYNIAFAILLFLGGFSQGFFLVQMTVLMPAKPPEKHTRFAEQVLALVILSSIGMLVLSCIPILAMRALGIEAATGAFPWLVVGASSTYMAKEFYVRHAFNQGHAHDAVFVHGLLALVLLSLVILVETTKTTISIDVALLFYMCAHLAAVAFGQFRARLQIRGHHLMELRDTLRELSSGGQWAAATNVVYALRSQAHTIVVAASIGPIGVAQLSAARLLVTPAALLIPALSQVTLPRLARLREIEGIDGMRRAQRKITAALVAIAGLYSLGLLITYPVLSELVFGNGYDGLFWISAMWCLYAIALACRSSVDWMAQALRHFRSITIVNIASAAVTLFSVYFLSNKWGLLGATLGTVIGEISVAIGLIFVINHYAGRSNVHRAP